MIEVAEAIDKAIELFQLVHKDLVAAGEIVELLVEEAEFSTDQNSWTITLGYSRQGEVSTSTIGEALGQINPKLTRRFKTFRIDAESGRVQSMKTPKVGGV